MFSFTDTIYVIESTFCIKASNVFLIFRAKITFFDGGSEYYGQHPTNFDDSVVKKAEPPHSHY